MSTKPVNMRATTATRTGSVRHGVGHKTFSSGRSNRNAAEDSRPNVLQLNTEGLTANKISVIEQLAQWFSKFFSNSPLTNPNTVNSSRKKITNDTRKNFTLPTMKKEEKIMN